MTYHPSHSPTAVQVILSFLRLLPWHRQSSWVVSVMIWSSSYFKKLSLFGPPFISLDVRLHHLRQPTMMNWSRRVWTVGMSKWIKRDKGMSVRRLTMEDYYLSTIIKERQSLYGRWSSVFVSHTPAYAMFSQLWALSFQRYYRSSYQFWCQEWPIWYQLSWSSVPGRWQRSPLTRRRSMVWVSLSSVSMFYSHKFLID